MFKRRWFFHALVVLSVLVLGVQAQTPMAVVTEMRLVRMDYASDPELVGATVDFDVQEVVPGQTGLGFLNVVTDLNWLYQQDGLEWICRNIPVHVSPDLTEVSHSVWFDPTVFSTADDVGEHDVLPGLHYSVWAMISDEELSDPPTPDVVELWDYSILPGGYGIWGLYDTLAGPGGDSDAGPPVVTDPAQTQGDIASPLRTTMPDIGQKSMECGPTSCANSLLWLAKKHGFDDLLPEKQDELIRALMKAMTGSDKRPFPGLSPGQMRDGKIKFAKEQELPIIVKGGFPDEDAKGAKAFDFIKKEFDAGEDVEMLINWPGGGAHWVTVVGYAVKGDRLFVKVHDPDDGKTATVTWELDRQGRFINPKGTMNRAVSESFVPQDTLALPDPSAGGHHTYGGHLEHHDDGTTTFVEEESSSLEHYYDLAAHTIHLKNEDVDNETKIVHLTATFFVPIENDRRHPRFNPRTDKKWATIQTTSQVVVRNKSYSYGGSAGQFLEIDQRWKLVPNPETETLDLSAFFVGTYPLRLLRFKVDTWCLPEKVQTEQTDGHTTVGEDGRVDTIQIRLAESPGEDMFVAVLPGSPGGRLILSPPDLVFDASNWDIPQSIHVAVEDDDEATGIRTEIISLGLVSPNPVFVNGYLPPIPVTVIDDECGPWGYPDADLNKDCCVNIQDLAILAEQWLECIICPPLVAAD